jgi:hypothetical protein
MSGSMRKISRAPRLFSVICFGLFVSTFATSIHAEVAIAGGADSLQLKASKATVREAIDALSTKFKFRYSPSAILDSPLDGTYRGSLRQVLARLLQGCSFVATEHSDRINAVIILDAGEKTETAAMPQLPATPVIVPRPAVPLLQPQLAPNAHRSARPRTKTED